MSKTHCKPLPTIAKWEIAKFHKFVDKRGPNECWPWKSTLTRAGYGAFIVYYRKPVMATRVAYLLEHGVDPYPLNILHSCDNPPCVNPAHLIAGTQMQNIHDMMAKGRANFPKGGGKPWKLDAVSVMTIRILHPTGWYTLRQLGDAFGVTKNMIHMIVKGKSWQSGGFPS